MKVALTRPVLLFVDSISHHAEMAKNVKPLLPSVGIVALPWKRKINLYSRLLIFLPPLPTTYDLPLTRYYLLPTKAHGWGLGCWAGGWARGGVES